MTFLTDPANFDELSDSLKDLNNLRKQLYSAAEYFELSYTNEDQKQIVGKTLKDYAIEALVSTVDHLGSVTFKVNDLLDGKVDEVTEIELRVSCVEQRLRTCQKQINHEGLLQQSLVINTPKYHKRYILPVGDTTEGTNLSNIKYQGCSLDDDDDWYQNKNAVRAPIRESPPSAARKGCSPTHPPHLRQSRKYSFSGTNPKKELGKGPEDRRTVSPHRFPHVRTASLSSRPSTPKSSRPSTPNPRPTTPNPSNRRRYPEPCKSASMRLHVDNITTRDTAQNPSKGKRLLKALLSRRKSRKDDMLYAYLDEY
ncbi:hypothetical protein K7X08_025847 [Anisodus acutangulus]|uniref:Uncharacterized protein n=1 Tax=Anisodus acutangulus TaxID=402998 RepID=A0A9Q1QXI7_9SOLA|nr:hypothetical protein K7X08_025847 [Anisodus acutangulus]